MIRTAIKLAQQLRTQKQVLPFLASSVLPSLTADREARRPIFVMSAASSGSTWIAALLGHLRSHVFVHQVKLYGGRSRAIWHAIESLGPLVPDRALFVMLEAFERGRLWTLPLHSDYVQDRPELLSDWNLKSLDPNHPRKSHASYDVVESGGPQVAIVPLLRRAYPNAIFCYVVRDPRDVVLSEKYRKPFGKDATIEHFASKFVETYEKCEAFKDEYGIDVLRYEDWLADTEGQLRAFLERHRLEMTEEEVRATVLMHDAKAMKSGKTKKLGNLVAGKAKGWQNELTEVDKQLIKPVLDQILVNLAYEKDVSW